MKDASLMPKLPSIRHAKHFITALAASAFSSLVMAGDKITPPSFVNSASTRNLNDAGHELNLWVIGFLTVVIALASAFAGYYFFNGENSKGVEQAKNILIGGAVTAVLGTIVFTVINKLGG